MVVCPPGALKRTALNVEPIGQDSAPGEPGSPLGPGGPAGPAGPCGPVPVGMSIVTVVVGCDWPVTAFATRNPLLAASTSAPTSGRNLIMFRNLDPFV